MDTNKDKRYGEHPKSSTHEKEEWYKVINKIDEGKEGVSMNDILKSNLILKDVMKDVKNGWNERKWLRKKKMIFKKRENLYLFYIFYI